MWDIVIQNLPTVLLVLAAFVICGAELIKAFRTWKDERQHYRNDIREEVSHEFEEKNQYQELHNKMDQMLDHLANIDSRLDDMDSRNAASEAKINILIDSDKDDIKGWIVDKYHEFYSRKGWIDAFSMDAIEKRFSTYEKEGGNHYVKNLVNQLRSLPMDPNESIHKNKERKE
jgi:hypothetical protein